MLNVPATLAATVLWINAPQGKTPRKIAQDQQQETTLPGYLDRMADLLLERICTNRWEEMRFARVREHTLTILHR